MSLADSAPAVMSRLLYSPVETETLLGISHATLYRLIRAGRLDRPVRSSRPTVRARSSSPASNFRPLSRALCATTAARVVRLRGPIILLN
jgi:predicted DNA-binding transcriptional regulator AlpA